MTIDEKKDSMSTDKETIATLAAALAAKTKENDGYRKELRIADDLYSAEVVTRRMLQRENDTMAKNFAALRQSYEEKHCELERQYAIIRILRDKVDNLWAASKAA